MNWTSFDAFWHMGGYGLYVWGSYGVALVVMIGEAWMARQRQRAARHGLDDDAEAEQ